jgi:soluble lytic murein transglycosylase-like protein
MATLTSIAAPVAWASLALAVPVAVPASDAPSASPPAFRTSPAVERWRPYIAEAAQRFAIPQAWIAAVMQAESAGLTHLNGRPITSPAGAMGLMQLMPGTWAAMRRRHGLGADPYDPHDNIMAGAAYLREMHDRYGSEAAMLAAYNAGPGRYEQYLSRGRPLPRETRAYLAKLTAVTGNSGYAKLAAAPPPDPFAWRRAGLFPARADGIPNTEDAVTDEASDSSPTAPPGAVEPPANGLFVSLSGQ